MAAHQMVTPWVEVERNAQRHLHSSVNYFPTPTKGGDTTGKTRVLVEDLISNCGSGSRCDATYATLREYIRLQPCSGGWATLSIVFEKETKAPPPPTIGEKLDRIRDAFGLSMSALADVLQASRASVYNWYETAPRSEHILQRIETLLGIAQNWQEMNPYHYPPGKLMKQKLGDGPSMLEHLGREELDIEEIQKGLEGLLALMRKQRERMDRAMARSTNAPTDSESHKELLERITGSVTADK